MGAKQAAGARVRQLMDEHGLRAWAFRWSRSTRRAGLCRYPFAGRPGVVELGLAHARANGFAAWLVDGVALHEIAHALHPGRQHDAVWAATNARLGGLPCGPDPRERDARRWTATCPACLIFYRAMSPPKPGYSLCCRGCLAPLAFSDTPPAPKDPSPC